MPIAHVSTATTINPGGGFSTTCPFALPSSSVGDVLIAHFSISTTVGSSGLDTIGSPAGWTRLINSADFTTTAFDIWMKVSAGESGIASWFSLAPDDYIDGTISAYSGADTSVIVDGTPSITQNTPTATPVSPSLTPTRGGCMLICCLFAPSFAATITKPSSMTQRANFDSANALADETIPSIGATGTRQWTLNTAVSTYTTSVLLRLFGLSTVPPATSGSGVMSIQQRTS